MKKQYRIDFFQLQIAPTAHAKTVTDALKVVCNQAAPVSAKIGQFARELYRPIWSSKGRNLAAQFRKLRNTDLPSKGKLGGAEYQLGLADDEGLFEKNFLVFFGTHDVLGWHSNGNGSSVNHFCRFLSKNLGGVEVSAEPLIQADAIKRLLKGGVEMRSVVLSIPRPKNPDLYDGLQDDFSKEVMDILSSSGGDRIKLQVSIDGRRIDTDGKLKGKIKRAVAELARDANATTARIEVDDDGIRHPIDLLADRISSVQEVEHDGRYPAFNEMIKIIKTAYDERLTEINAYFSSAGGSLR